MSLMRSLSLATAAALLLCTASLAQKPISQTARPAGRQSLAGHLSAEIVQAPLVGKLDNATQLYLAIGLPLRNEKQLDTELKELYDPKSPQFHHFLTPEEFAGKFGASEKDYRALTAFARHHGLKVTGTFSDHLLLSVTSTAAAANKAFHLQLVTRNRPDGSIFYAPDREPSLDLDTKILHISGLDNFVRTERAETGSGPGGSFGGSDFRNAYAPGVSQTGNGQTVGLFELEGFYVSDINRYQAKFAQAIPRQIPLRVITSDGYLANSTQSGPPFGGCKGTAPNPPPAGTPLPHNAEISLDIEVAMAMAPGLDNIYVYEGCNIDTVMENMASTKLPDGSLPQQLSSSWIFETTPNTLRIVKQIARQGQTLLVITGDNHALCPTENATSSRALPYATIVGGTILQMKDHSKAWKSETAATDGGGVLNGVPLPSYQQGASAGVEDLSSDWRLTPDVSMVSCDGSGGACGVFIYDNNNGVGGAVGGTSVAAPLWAGYVALANELRSQKGFGPLGFLNPALYSVYANPPEYAQDFHDIVSGSTPANPCSTGVPYSAGVGYDLITGLGSPTAQLITDLLPPPTPECTLNIACNGNIDSITCTGPDVGMAWNGKCYGIGVTYEEQIGCAAGFNGSSTVTLGASSNLSGPVQVCTQTAQGQKCKNYPEHPFVPTCVSGAPPPSPPPRCGEGEAFCDRLNPPQCVRAGSCPTVIPNKPPPS
jgi:subtilase family serine protease